MNTQESQGAAAISRRDMLRRSAVLGGALAVAAPTVQSFARPAFASTPRDVTGDFSNLYIVVCVNEVLYTFKYVKGGSTLDEGGNWATAPGQPGWTDCDLYDTYDDNDDNRLADVGLTQDDLFATVQLTTGDVYVAINCAFEKTINDEAVPFNAQVFGAAYTEGGLPCIDFSGDVDTRNGFTASATTKEVRLSTTGNTAGGSCPTCATPTAGESLEQPEPLSEDDLQEEPDEEVNTTADDGEESSSAENLEDREASPDDDGDEKTEPKEKPKAESHEAEGEDEDENETNE